MSYSPNAYVPPPPPAARRGKSPWFFVGMGCLGLFLVTIGLISYSAYKVMGVLKQPITSAGVVQSLGDVPIYPNAKLDMTMTKVIQGTAAVTQMVTGKNTFSAGVFQVPVTPEAAVSWYDTEMVKRGYVANKVRQSSVGQKLQSQVQRQYSSKTIKEIVIVQAGLTPEEQRTDPKNGTMLILMRMTNLKGKANPPENAGKEFVPDAPATKK